MLRDAQYSTLSGHTKSQIFTTIYGMLPPTHTHKARQAMRLTLYQICCIVLLVTGCTQAATVQQRATAPTPTPPQVRTTAVTAFTASPVSSVPQSATTAVVTATTTIATVTVVARRRYAFPIAQGTVTYGKDHHDYPATDIFCDEGSVFVAVTDGVIDAIVADDVWDPATDVPSDRSGRAVALIGDDGVRYYGSHLSEITAGLAVGQRVRVGAILGLTGKSGNARYTPPHLHFGISPPTTPDDWQVRRGQVSPYLYLKAWQNGESLTPVFDQN